MSHNTNTEIEVGDEVRVVSPRVHMPKHFDLKDFIVTHIIEDGCFGVGEGFFYFDELEIMRPKAELESVMEEDKRLLDKMKECYELCEMMHQESVIPSFLPETLKLIFDDR
jgi:hypothetical protein